MKFTLVFIIFFSFFFLFPFDSYAYTGRVGAYFFHWYRCPGVVDPDPHNPGITACDPSKIVHHGVGMNVPYPEGGYYNSGNLNWYKREFSDMAISGITDIFPVDFYDANQVTLMSQAIASLNLPLKIGFFWDPPSDAINFNLNNQTDLERLYATYLKPHFIALPRSLWSTIHGQDGVDHPVIFTVYAETNSVNNPNCGQPNVYCGMYPLTNDRVLALFEHLKNRFTSDFGVSPLLVLESSWFAYSNYLSSYAKYSWGIDKTSGISIDEHNGIKIINVSAGVDMRKTPWGGPDSLYIDREGGNYFRRALSNVPSSGTFLTVGWNELFETAGISRTVDYFDLLGRPMKDIAYMQILQEFLGKPAIPAFTNLPPTPTNINASCDSVRCTFSWDSLASTYADNIRYMYKIFDSTRNGNEKLCSPYSFTNELNISHGGGCLRGNTNDVISKSSLINDQNFQSACPNNTCTLSVWAKDGNNNYSEVATKTFTVTTTPLFLKKGWNKIVWPDISGKTTNDLPPSCIRLSVKNSRLSGWVGGFKGNVEFDSAKTYYVHCKENGAWNL